jgi:hypothetical protein
MLRLIRVCFGLDHYLSAAILHVGQRAARLSERCPAGRRESRLNGGCSELSKGINARKSRPPFVVPLAKGDPSRPGPAIHILRNSASILRNSAFICCVEPPLSG